MSQTLSLPPAATPNPPGEIDPVAQSIELRKGLLYGLGAYCAWGIAPAYYKLLVTVPPIQVLAHRVVWSVAFLTPLIWSRGLWKQVIAAITNYRTLLCLLASTVFITSNWYVFVYSVTTNRVLESAMGYYMNPLVNVLLGTIFLKERLRRWQTISVLLATLAILLMTFKMGRLPTITIILALSFAFYGFIRKLTPVGPMVGLYIETLILLPFAIYLLAGKSIPIVPAGKNIVGSTAILAFAGIMTAVPLLWFANAAQRLRLTTIGLLQYLTPTCSFILSVAFFGEKFQPIQFIAFPLIWIALVVFSVDSIRAYRAQQRVRMLPVLTEV